MQPINIFSRLHICLSCYRYLPFYDLTRFDRNFYIFYYKPPISSFIHNFKYNGNMAYGRLLADLLVARLQRKPYILQVIKQSLIIPIPIHQSKIKKRGFDHGGYILNKAAVKLGLNTDFNYLYLNKNINSQVSQANHASRMANVDGAFSLRERIHEDSSNLIIFDDILTTGATINEAQKTIQLTNPNVSFSHLCLCFNKSDL